jgi:hypothetical protein
MIRDKLGIAWGVAISTIFGLFAIAAICAVSGEAEIGWLDKMLVVLFWPATQVLLLVAMVYPDIGLRQLAPPFYIGYMFILGFFAGFYSYKVRSRMRKRRGLK